MDYSKDLIGKKIIIFGASRGIGFNIASSLLAKGADVIISSGNENNLNDALLRLKQKHPTKNVDKVIADLSNHETLDDALSPLLNQKFDAMILSAAVLGPSSGDFSKTDLEDFISAFNVNLFGNVKLVHFFLEKNLLHKNSKILIMSGGISSPDPYFIAYSSTKHALNGFAYSLSYQLSAREIWVNSILPGSYNTDINKTRIERGPESVGITNFRISLARANEDDTEKYQKLNQLIEFLCSSSSNGVYGRLISAQYDDWENNVERLKSDKDDLYKIIRKTG